MKAQLIDATTAFLMAASAIVVGGALGAAMNLLLDMIGG